MRISEWSSDVCSADLLEAFFQIDAGQVAFPFAVITVEQALGGCLPGGDDLAQRIKEADFIVPDAVKARPGGKAGCGDVQNAPAQLQEASSARPCCAQPQLRHFVADPVMVLEDRKSTRLNSSH